MFQAYTNKCTNFTEDLKIPTCLGAEKPSSGNPKYDAVQTPTHQSEKYSGDTKIPTYNKIVRYINVL
jgi:hypothetical protein